MKVKFTKEALAQLGILQNLDTSVTGFMTGFKIGKLTIIKNIMPIHFTKKNVDEVYRKVFLKTKFSLQGVFFINLSPFSCDWFSGDIILKVLDAKKEIVFCDFDENMKLVNRGFERGYERSIL